MTDLRQTEQYTRYMKLLGWDVDKLSKVYCYSRKIPILGYFVKIQRSEKLIPKNAIKRLRKVKRIYFISIEPLDDKQFKNYKSYGFKISKTSSLPSKTIQIDLRKNLDDILKNMHYKTRYNIGLSSRRKIVIKFSKDIDIFIEFWQKSAKKRGFFLPLKREIDSLYRAFGKNAHLMSAYYEEDLIAAVLLVNTKDAMHYMYAASTSIGNKNFAPSLLIWESIKLAKSLRLKIFDFGGIYDERYPLEKWKGFSHFKQGFGGSEVTYPMTLTKSFFPFGLKFL